MSEPGASAEPSRPPYGEYASPEEQRARIQQPVHPPASPQPVGPASPAPAARRRPFDLIATVALLAYGLVTVFSAVPRLLDVAPYISEILSVTGIDAELADPAAARGYGVAAAVVMVVLWLAAAILSWMRLRRGRFAFWIPLVAGLAANAITTVLLSVPMLTDPAVRAAIMAAYGG